MDFVGRMERLPEDLITGLEMAGEKVNRSRVRRLKPMNSSRGEYDTEALPETVERLNAAEHWVLETFYE